MPAVHSLSHKWSYPCHVRNRFLQQRFPLGRHTPTSPMQQQQQKHITPLNSSSVTEEKRKETTQANESQTIKNIYRLSSVPDVCIFEDFPGWSAACIYFTHLQCLCASSGIHGVPSLPPYLAWTAVLGLCSAFPCPWEKRPHLHMVQDRSS